VITPARPTLAYVVNSLNPGGTEKLVVDMSLAFSADFNVQVVCLDEPGRWAATLRERGIEVSCVWRQPGMDLSVPRKLAERFRRARVDIIHAHQCTPWFYAALSRLSHSSPRLLLEEHGRFYPEVTNRKRAFINRHLIRRLTHAFVAVSDDIRRRLEIYEGLDARQVEVIYNGIAAPAPLPDDERGALRASFGIGPGDFVIGTVGRFDTIKNLPMLVGALASVGQAAPRVRGLLVGDGPVMASIRGLVASTGMADRIHLSGYRSDAGNLTQCMDLFVLTSLSEGTSMALLEAMAAGVPAAVTAVGGNPEIVLDGATGWTVPSGDVDALARVMRSAVTSDEPRGSYAGAGRSRYTEHFTVQRMIESYRARYLRLLETMPGRPEAS
jgi:glycosyltransferase involved in cell wall biosynthesis